ncbi:hypothetical protein ACMFMF_004320 [Clarireedia jacksonii]
MFRATRFPVQQARSMVQRRTRRSPLFGQYQGQCQQRTFINIPNFLLPPLYFVGLGIGLWTWKCLMMITFQNKIIYMPGLPPNARQETIANYQKECLGIQWREEKIKSTDGTSISLCVAEVNAGTKEKSPRKTIYILYFQGHCPPLMVLAFFFTPLFTRCAGNASSLPPRLPFLSSVPRKLQKAGGKMDDPVQYVFVCCSYRGYWTSSGRPSERGIIRDAEATLHWVKKNFEARANPDGCDVILWGQSIGAGVATGLAAKEDMFSSQLRLQLLILETPFLGMYASHRQV